MKHKKFNEVYPYTYYIKHKESGFKYYGLRWANTTGKSNISRCSPVEDFLVNYFTSLSNKKYKWFKDELVLNKNNFEIKLHYTFDSIEEACSYEKQILNKIIHKSDWINTGNSVYSNWYKLSELQKGITKQKMRDNHADFSGENHPRWGYRFTKEEKLKHSLKMKEYYANNPEKVMSGSNNPMYGIGDNYKAISPDGVEYIINQGFSIFCRERGIDPSAARRCAQGKNLTAKKWKFEFIPE